MYGSCDFREDPGQEDSVGGAPQGRGDGTPRTVVVLHKIASPQL